MQANLPNSFFVVAGSVGLGAVTVNLIPECGEDRDFSLKICDKKIKRLRITMINFGSDVCSVNGVLSMIT